MGLLEIMSTFDWISPLIAFIQDLARGDPLRRRSWTFYVDVDAGWSGAQLQRLLRRHGVKIFGGMIHNGDIFFQVEKRQAQWAEMVLLRSGVPLKYHLFSARNSRYQYPQPERRAGSSKDVLTRLDELLDSI